MGTAMYWVEWQRGGESRRQVAVCEGIIACGFVGFAEFVIGERAVQWPAKKKY